MNSFWQRSDLRISNVRAERTKLTSVEIQQAIRVNLFHILQASARAEGSGVPAKGLTGQAYEGQYFWDTEIYLLLYDLYITAYNQEPVAVQAWNAGPGARPGP